MDNLNNQQNQNIQSANTPQAVYTQPTHNALPTYYPPYIPMYKKVYKPIEKRDVNFIFAFFGAVLLLVDFAFFGGFHLGFTISYAVLFTVSTLYLYKKGGRASFFSICCGILSLIGSITFTLYNDYFINTIMVALICGLYVIYTLGISNTFVNSQGSFKLFIDMVLAVFYHPIDRFSELVGSIKAGSRKNKKVIGVLAGALLAIPVLCVVVPLLIKSDAAFQSLVEKLIKSIAVYIAQLLIAVVLTPYVFSYMYVKRHKPEGGMPTSTNMRKPVPTYAVTSFMSVISIVYIVYLFSQLAYFFSAFKGILPADYKYSASAFARRGFFEMFAICVINCIIISLASMLINKRSALFKSLSCFVSLFSVLLIITAMQKMKLNISIFGLSKNRVLVSVFMIMLLVTIAFFIMHIFAPRVSYMQGIIVICSVIFIALSFCNIDGYIAKYNIDAFQSGKISLDVESFSALGDGAIPYLEVLSTNYDAGIAKQATHILVDNASQHYGKYTSTTKDKIYINTNLDFRDYNITKKQALDSIKRLANSNKSFQNEYKLIALEDSYYDCDSDEYTVYDSSAGKDYTYKYNYSTRMYERELSTIYSSKDNN